MDLDFSEEQQILREMVRGVCAEQCPLEDVRRMEDDPRGYTSKLWQALVDQGLVGMLLPETYGGSGQSLLEAVILYEELGRALAPTPHFVSAVLGARVLLAAGSEGQRREWLPRIASGDAIFTPAWLEPDGSFGPGGIRMRAASDGEGFVLTGTKCHVPFASAANRLLVLARTGEGEREIDLFLVDPVASGIGLEQQRSLASDTQYRVEFDGVRVPATARVGAAASGWTNWDHAMLDGVILQAALAMGGAERALEMTVEYAKERKQFDKPIGAFQAIAHYLADASTEVEGAKTLVYQAAWTRAQGRSACRLAPMAKLIAAQVFRDTTKTCQQVWGGVGFSIEYDIQLFFRRAKQLQLSWWDTRHLEELVAADVLDG